MSGERFIAVQLVGTERYALASFLPGLPTLPRFVREAHRDVLRWPSYSAAVNGLASTYASASLSVPPHVSVVRETTTIRHRTSRADAAAERRASGGGG